MRRKRKRGGESQGGNINRKVSNAISTTYCVLHYRDVATVGVSVKEDPHEAIIVLLDVHGVGHREHVRCEELGTNVGMEMIRKHNKISNRIRTRMIHVIAMVIVKDNR